MQKLLINDEINIENLIYEVRGKQVMLASDVAKLYNSETKIINQVVKRNLNRFPKEFCFQLTIKEYSDLKSQFVTSKNNLFFSERGGNRYLSLMNIENCGFNLKPQIIIICQEHFHMYLQKRELQCLRQYFTHQLLKKLVFQ